MTGPGTGGDSDGSDLPASDDSDGSDLPDGNDRLDGSLEDDPERSEHPADAAVSTGNGGVDRSGDGSPHGSGSSTDSRSRDEPAVTIEEDGVVRWFLRTNNETVAIVRDLATSIAVVALIGLLLFGVSGVWPPLVAVESGSMEPNMAKGDLVFVADQERFVGDGSIEGTGVVPYADGAESDYTKFDDHGDVIIFYPNGNEMQTPVIHRAYYWVEAGEDWVATHGEQDRLNGNTCADLVTCPAPHDGFVTMGDANAGYDQVANTGADTDVVKPEWITGKGMFRIPWLGYVRLTFDNLLATGPTIAGAGILPGIGGLILVGGVLTANSIRRY